MQLSYLNRAGGVLRAVWWEELATLLVGLSGHAELYPLDAGALSDELTERLGSVANEQPIEAGFMSMAPRTIYIRTFKNGAT